MLDAAFILIVILFFVTAYLFALGISGLARSDNNRPAK